MNKNEKILKYVNEIYSYDGVVEYVNKVIDDLDNDVYRINKFYSKQFWKIDS